MKKHYGGDMMRPLVYCGHCKCFQPMARTLQGKICNKCKATIKEIKIKNRNKVHGA